MYMNISSLSLSIYIYIYIHNTLNKHSYYFFIDTPCLLSRAPSRREHCGSVSGDGVGIGQGGTPLSL